MSKYADRLLKFYEENPDFIQPESRKNEMIIIATVRLSKLPKSFAKSKLILSTNPSGVKTPSAPNGTSLNK